MAKLALITSTFIPAFALGAQSVNANNGFFSAVAITSFVIGCGQMVLLKLAPNARWREIAAFLFGGPFGITLVCGRIQGRKDTNRMLKNVTNEAEIRKKWAKKRSLHAVNEQF